MMPPPEGYGGTEQQNTFPREEQYFMLELEHIQKSFDGVPGLKDISLQVQTERSFPFWAPPAVERPRC